MFDQLALNQVLLDWKAFPSSFFPWHNHFESLWVPFTFRHPQSWSRSEWSYSWSATQVQRCFFFVFFCFLSFWQMPSPHNIANREQNKNNIINTIKKTKGKEDKDACCWNQEPCRKVICCWFWSRLCYCYLNISSY